MRCVPAACQLNIIASYDYYNKDSGLHENATNEDRAGEDGQTQKENILDERTKLFAV